MLWVLASGLALWVAYGVLQRAAGNLHALIRRPRLGAMTHDVLRLLVVNFCERVVCLTMRV